jgi:hypothetical protein
MHHPSQFQEMARTRQQDRLRAAEAHRAARKARQGAPAARRWSVRMVTAVLRFMVRVIAAGRRPVATPGSCPSLACKHPNGESAMKTRTMLLAVVLLAILLAAGTAVAAPPRTEFTGTEVYGASLDFGTETFPGNNNYHVRGAVDLLFFTGSDPRVTGENEVTINLNFQFVPEPVFVRGPMWGTFRLANEGGYWEGIWNGVRDTNGFSYYHFVGHGRGGYAGLQLMMDGERLTPDPTQPEHYRGVIIEAGG